MSGSWSSRARAILLLLAARLLLGAGSAAADDAGALCGRVADGSGAPVPSAAVVVVELGIEARTGSDGRYEIKGIPAGSYAVEARAGGYSIDAAEAIEIVAGRTAEKDFRLIALEVPLREIVVTSSVSIFGEVPASAASLDRDQITALPHFGDDPYRAIAVLPGTSGGDISGRFNVRGGFHDEPPSDREPRQPRDQLHQRVGEHGRLVFERQGQVAGIAPARIPGPRPRPGGGRRRGSAGP